MGGILGNNFVHTLFSRRFFEQLKHFLVVANQSIEVNADDCLAKLHPFLDSVKKKSHESWAPGRKQGMNESQQQCGHCNSRCSHCVEIPKPLLDYIKIVASHESNTGYFYAFLVDEWLPNMKVVDLIMAVLAQYPDARELDGEDTQTRTFAFDHSYITVDNGRKAWADHRQLIYGTIRGDRLPQHCGIGNPRLQDGEFVWRQSDLPLPLTIFHWHDSDPKGSWFLSPYHGIDSFEVSRQCRGQETSTKNFPISAK